MRSRGTISQRLRVLASAVLAALSAAACDGNYRTPTAVPDVTRPGRTDLTFIGESVVLSVTGTPPPCDAPVQQVGQRSANIYWFVTLQGESITLSDEWDTSYGGTLQERSFTVSLGAAAAEQATPCDLREASISGSFSEDFGSFQAQETRRWGPLERELRTVVSWTGVRSQ